MSKLRANEIVNHEDTGSPSFPYGATTPVPTANDQFANKSYTDSVASTVSSDIKNTISSTPPESPVVGHFWTDTSKARISLKIWNGDSWVFLKNSRERLTGQVVSPPTIINPNLSNPSGFVKIIPTMLTRTSAVVANARFIKSQWSKDGVAISQHTNADAEYYVTEVGTYKYEETWADDFGVELTTSETMVINADAGTINEQPIMASTNGTLVPTTLNITRPTVSAATLSEVKWYKDDVVIPNLTSLSLSLPKLITAIGTYRYEETWIDEFGNPVAPSVSLEIAAPRGVIDAEAAISSSDGIYYPTTLTVARPVVSEATFSEAKWYKDDVEIPGATGTTFQATEMATFKYEETWIDMYGDEVTPSVSMFVSARDGVIDAQPVITDPKSHLSAPQTLPVVSIIPTTLTASRPTVSHAVFGGSKWYKDDVEIVGITGVELAVSELGTYKYEETWVDEFGVQVLPTQSVVIHANNGVINSPPSISDSNSGYIPTLMTAVSASVSDSTFTSSKWYKDDVEISGATGSTYYATEMGTYKYEEIWIDDLGNQLTTSTTSVITAHAGSIDAQPTLASSDGTYYPTTLTVSRPTVSNHVTYLGSKWYKDDVEISAATGFEYQATEMAVYKYEETWVDIFGTQLHPTVSANILARPGVVDSDPSISNPQAGIIPIIPTTLSATSPTVSHATFSGSKWYKDDVEVTESAGLKFLYVSELGTYKYEETWVDEYGTQLFPSLTTIIDANSGSVNSQPTISDSNSGYIPTTLTAEASEVVNATFMGSKWYKDDVEISGETGSVLQVGSASADMGAYKYEETWVDNLGTQFTPSASMVITARPSVIDALPAISSSNGSFYPTTLTAAQATVANASFVGSQWYKNGVAIPGATGFVLEATEMAEFRYQETWVDLFGSQISARADINVNARPGVVDVQPSISNPKAGSTPIIPTTLTATRPTVSHADFVVSKWYKDGSLIADATGLQLSVSVVGSYKYEEVWVDEYGTELTPSLTAIVNADAGSIDVPPSITSSDGIYYPTTLTGVSPVVTNANYVSSQWYKDDVAISGATGSTYEATEMATYKYEETWADDLGTQLFPNTSLFISARDGSVDSQPTIASSEGTYYPTTLTATRPTVSHATFSGSKWYKNGVAIAGPTAANLVLQATEMATYKYEETWVDEFGVEFLPSLSIDIVARPGVVDSQPSITNPQAGSTPIIPTTLTATRPTVSHADFVVSKWYKDDVEILGATGVQLDVTELGVYEYEEVWVDEYGTQLLPSFVSVVHADAGSIDSQPTISDTNSGYIPTTLTATRPTVSNADFASAQWYKDETPITETYNPQTSSVVNVVDKSVVGGSWTVHNPNVGSGWMVFGNASSPSIMVAAGAVNDGSNSGANIDGNRKIRYTTDGVNWNWGSTNLSGEYQSPHKIVYNPNQNQFVFVCQGEYGRSNLIHYSSDGINWSQASHPANVRLNSLAYDGNNYVATSFVGEHCVISSNGTSWSNGGNMAGDCSAGLAGGNGVFIAVDGGSNRIRRSTNGGSSWDYNIYVQSGITARDVETDGSGTWVIVSTGATSNGNKVLYSTDNAQSWSEVSSSTYGYSKVAYGNGKWVFNNGVIFKVCDTNNGGDISDASTWVNGINNFSGGSTVWDFSYGQFNASPTGEVWMTGNYPNHWWTYSPLPSSTSYELELSDNSIDGVPGQTIGDLFTANSHVTGSSGGYGNLQSTADNSTNKMTLVNAGGTWSVGDVVSRTTQTTRPYSSQSLDATEMGAYKYEETWTDDIGTQLKPSSTSVITAYPGSIDVHPTLSDSNGGYIPTVITATRPTVSNADFVGSNWYKDDVEIAGASGVTFNATSMGKYRYVETWVDAFGTEHKASKTVNITAYPGSIDAQPVITDPKSHLSAPQTLPVIPVIPTTLTATSPTVSHATFVSSQWYKNGSPVTGATGLTLSVTELGIYRYEETWVDAFGTEHKPSETSIIRVNAGFVSIAPIISDTNSGYIPTTLTAARPTVPHATFTGSKWYKDDVEMSGVTGLELSLPDNPSSMGTYKYEETWVDDLGNTIITSDSSVITAYAGAISSQPSISSSNGVYYPSTLTATPATVTNATLVGYKWYQDDVLIPNANGLVYQATAMAKYRFEETWVDAFGTQLFPSVSVVVVAYAGTIDSLPSISDDNGGYLPSKFIDEVQLPVTLTATRPTVSNATFSGSKWYKNAMELVAEAGNLQISVTEMATYRYVETWVDEFGTELLPSSSAFIASPPGEIISQPTVSDTNGQLTPTTLTATTAVVKNAAFVSSQWYKDDEAIPSATAITYEATIAGTYKYEETWTDVNGLKTFPSVSTVLTPFNVIETPTVLTPTDEHGFFSDQFQVKTSDITSVTTTLGGGKLGNLPEHSEWSNLTYGVVNGQAMYVAIARKGTYGISTQQTKYHWRDYGGKYSCNKIAYSYDGVTWYEADAPNDISWSNIAYGEVNGAGRFVAIGATRNILSADAPQPYDSHYTTYQISDSNAMYSDDGINWISTNFDGYGTKYHQWRGLTYSGGKFFAIAGSTASIWTNSLSASDDEDFLQWGDGSSWNDTNISQVNYWSNIGGKPDHATGSFLAVAGSGIYNRSSYTSGGISRYSTGTKHLCWIHPTSSTNQGNGTWMNYSYYGWAATDMILKDGSKYNNKDHGVYWRDVVYADGLWVAISSSGYRKLAYTETTGGAATWNITRTSNENGDRDWTHITYGEPGGHPMFLISCNEAVGRQDIRYATSNGYTGSGHYLDDWKDCIVSTDLTIMADTIQWANDRFVALGTDQTVDKEVLVYSHDGINWVSEYTELVLTDSTVLNVNDGSALTGAEESSEDIFTQGKEVEFPPNIGVTEYWATAFGGDRSGTSVGQDTANDMVIDGDGNVYTIGQHEFRYGPADNKYDSVLTKHNSSGHLEWHRVLGDRYQDFYRWSGREYTAYRQDYGVGIDLDGAGNIYTMTVSTKTSVDNETPGVVISKYDSSGNMKWQRSLTKPEDKTFDFFREHTGIKVSSTGDVYFIGGTQTVGWENRVEITVAGELHRVYPETLFIAKYNTSGTLQWQRTLRGELGDDYDIKDIVLDSSNNAYLFGTAKVANYNTLDEHKFGREVSIGSGKVVIGSPNNQIRDLSRPGAVYLYDLNGTTLSNEVRISLPEDATGTSFGRLVKVQSNKIVIADTTQVHIYNLDGTKELSFRPGGPAFTGTIYHLAVGGDKIAAYMSNDGYTSDNDRYVARIYDLSGNLEYSIIPPIAVDNGKSTTTVTSIAVDGSKIAFGCPYATGAGTDTGIPQLKRPNAAEGDFLYGETYSVSFQSSEYSKNGAVYVYNFDGTGETIITPSDLQYRWLEGNGYLGYPHNDFSSVDGAYGIGSGPNFIDGQRQFTISKYFGTNITIDDGKIAITAPGERLSMQAYRNSDGHTWTKLDVNSEYPAVYVFDLDGTNEVKIDQVGSDTHLSENGPYFSDVTYDVEFGKSVDISDGKIVIGAGKENVRASWSGGGRDSYIDDARSTDSGAVYIYNIDGTNGKRLKNADYVSAVSTSPTLTDFSDHLYGTSVAVANNKLIVGAPGMGLVSHTNAGVTPGLAFVYDMNEIEAASTDSVASAKYISMSGVTETIVSATDQTPALQTESDALFIKYNSSGVLQWLRKYDNGESSFLPEEKEDTGAAMAIDDSDNLYTIVHQRYSGKNVIVKQDTSGNILWQRSFKLQYTGVRGLTHTIGDESQEAKTVQDWSNTTYTHSLSNDRMMQINSHFITIDNSGNIIIAMELGSMGYYYRNAYSSKIAIIKYDSSGNLLWQRSFGNGSYTSGTEIVTGVKTDATGNIYICGSTSSFGPDYSSSYLGNTAGRYNYPTHDDDPGSSFIAKIPSDGSLTGVHGGFPYHDYISPYGLSYALEAGVDAGQAYIQVVTDLAETGLTHIPDTFIHAEGQMVSARSYMIDDKSPIFESTKVSFNAPSAKIYESSGNTIMLSETSGTWSVGDSLHTDYKAFVRSSVAGTIDPDDPTTLVLVASAPTATRGSINWGIAEWQVADDMDFTKNVQTFTKDLTESGAQTASPEFTLEPSKPYYVRARYFSADQPDVFSEWSTTSTFRTNGY